MPPSVCVHDALVLLQSAGAGAVGALLSSPLSKGLFHKAAMESGGFQHWTAMQMHHAQGNFHALIKYLQVPHRHGVGGLGACMTMHTWVR